MSAGNTTSLTLLDRIRAIPGVDDVANANIVPLSGSGWDNEVWIDNQSSPQRQVSNFSSVSPDYFHTLRIPMLGGRDFNDHDNSQSTRVAIVNEAFDGVIRIRRYLCDVCLRTVSLLPQWALPFMRFGIAEIAKTLKARLQESRVWKVAAPKAPYQRGQHWVRRWHLVA